jgi:hypothetical protein
VLLDQVLNLENRNPHFDAQVFNFLTASYENSIVVTEHCDWFVDQVRPENTLTTDVEIITIN